ncbi:MAG: LamG domain-containing protein [Phycisphaerae bacterium]
MSKKLIFLFSFVLVLGVAAGVTNGGSLWGYYPINENDLNDYSGNDHHGTAVDGPVTVLDAERGWVVAFNDQPSLPSRINCGTDDPSAGGELSVSVWIKWDGLNGNWQGMAGKSFQYGQRRWIFQLRDSDGIIQWGGTDSENLHIWSTVAPATGEWQHVAGTCDGSYSKVYINGQIVGEGPGGFSPDSAVEANVTLGFGEDRDDYDESLNGLMDEIYIYNRTLSDNQIVDLFHGIPASFVKADDPNPANGSLHTDTWANLSWSPGDTAVSHDVYVGDNFDDVNDGIADTFQGNQNAMFIVVGFPGFPFPDGLVPGMTYYWRIDQVEADGTTTHKGNVWSFTVPPKTAYYPDPADGAELVEPDVELGWTPGFGAKLHTVYFGDNFDEVDNAAGGLPQGVTAYSPGTLKMAKTYYWRVDEFDVIETHKGNVWSFTTQGAVGSPDPANGAVDVEHTPILTWTPGAYADSHQVFFGDDEDAVKNADTSSPEHKGTGNLGAESYEPEKLLWNTTYYWRIDEANNANPDSPWTGKVWSFTTANFLVVDDFEDYDTGENQIWYAWKDGLGYGTAGTEPYYPGNGTGSAVGDENTPSYTEETIVHGGNQAMPVFYDNSVLMYSEVEKTLTYPRDWTENGVTTLSIWFRGISDNAAETLYVALNGSAVVSHDNPNAAQIDKWTQWNIDLQAFADQGVNLANVNTIALGLGNKKNPQAGGSGTMYFDDIRLYPPPPEPEPAP